MESNGTRAEGPESRNLRLGHSRGGTRNRRPRKGHSRGGTRTRDPGIMRTGIPAWGQLAVCPYTTHGARDTRAIGRSIAPSLVPKRYSFLRPGQALPCSCRSWAWCRGDHPYHRPGHLQPGVRSAMACTARRPFDGWHHRALPPHTASHRASARLAACVWSAPQPWCPRR
jgi:hypothetical protein